MKIWVIGRSYPLPSNSMRGSFELEQAKMLAKHKNTVAYLACVFHPLRKVRKWGYCHWQDENVSIFTYSQFYAIDRMKLRWDWLKSRRWKFVLERAEAEMGLPDVIHVHYPTDITIAKDILEYQNRGVKIVCTEHWARVLLKAIDAYEKEQLTSYVNHADGFICVGRQLGESVTEITGSTKTVFVVPNIVNDAFTVSERKGEEFHFAFVGVFRPEKQMDLIIKAFAEQFRGRKSVKLTIIGGGSAKQEQYMHHLAESLSINDQVIFTGKLSRSGVAKALGDCNALICFSKYETFGVPIIEAWACGIPVIATTTVSVNETWDNRLGVQVKPDDPDSLKKQMMNVYTNYKQYDSEFISAYAREHYSEDVVYEKLMKIYRA